MWLSVANENSVSEKSFLSVAYFFADSQVVSTDPRSHIHLNSGLKNAKIRAVLPMFSLIYDSREIIVQSFRTDIKLSFIPKKLYNLEIFERFVRF